VSHSSIRQIGNDATGRKFPPRLRQQTMAYASLGLKVCIGAERDDSRDPGGQEGCYVSITDVVLSSRVGVNPP